MTPESGGVNALLEAAHNYRKAGWHPIPLHRVVNGCCSCSKGFNCSSKGKHPLFTKWQEGETPSDIDIETTWKTDRPPNIGIVTGTWFWVLDVDNMGLWDRFLASHGEQEEPDTYIVQTPRGGRHYYFLMPSEFHITNSSGRLPDGIDVRGDGGQVAAPPSKTDQGEYTVLNEAEICHAPAWLIALIQPKEESRPNPEPEPQPAQGPAFSSLPSNEQRRLRRYTDKAVEAEVDRLRACSKEAKPNGEGYIGPPWNKTTFEVACQLLDLAESPWSPLTARSARELLVQHSPRDSGFTFSDVSTIWQSALKRARAGQGRPLPADPSSGGFMDAPEVRSAPSSPQQPPPIDGGTTLEVSERVHSGQVRFAYRFAATGANKFLHVAGLGWYAWDGTRWLQDELSRAQLAVVQELKKALVESFDDKKLRSDISKCESAAGIGGILNIAKALPEFAHTVRDLDRDPYLLNVANGTLDLRTQELRPHDPTDRITKVCLGAYHPAERSALWDSFLERVLPDAETRSFLQRLAGVGLLGLVREHILAILTGTGQNGKTVFYESLNHALGDYASIGDPDLFMHRDGAHPTGEMDLLGLRWVVVSESDKNRRLAEATMKRLTGGDEIKARKMRQDFVSFRPSHTPILVTNNLPKVSGDDPALWRRIRVVPFNVTIPEPERNRHLPEQMQLAADAVLTWAIEGYNDYVTHDSLADPESVRVATEDYHRNSDSIMRFIEERCMKSEHATVPAADLYSAWQRWASHEQDAQMSARAFGLALDRLGYLAKRTMHARLRQGLLLLAESDEP